MKKLLSIALITILAISLLVACSNKKDDVSASATQTGNTDSAAPVEEESPNGFATRANGWEKDEESYNLRYRNPDNDSIIEFSAEEIPASISTPEAYVKYKQNQFKETDQFKDSEFTATVSTKAGGTDAVEFTFTTSVYDVVTKYRILYVCKDEKAYAITCSALEENFEESNVGFQEMIDSYTLD